VRAGELEVQENERRPLPLHPFDQALAVLGLEDRVADCPEEIHH